MNIQILTEAQIIKYFKNENLPENKLIKKYGQDEMELIGFLANGKKQVFVEKLNKNLTLIFSLVQEIDESKSGPIYYQIAAFDDEKQVAKLEYQIMEHGIHLSFIGIDENIGQAYQGKGIGYKLLKELEDNATLLNEEFIEGIYCPIGKFKNSTEKFYLNNGYEFYIDYADHGRSCIYKKLKSKSSLSKEEGQPSANS